MRDEKNDAVKRIRPLKNGDPLPVIIGLAVGIVVLVVVLVLVLVFVVGGKKSKDDDPDDQLAVQTEEVITAVETESESEIASESETETAESETQSESEMLTDALMEESETELDVESMYADEAAEILAGMTVEEKVDQLFFITPLALIKANGAGEDYTYVETVGSVTTAAYKAIPVGGVIVGMNNRTSSSQDIAKFVEDLRELSENVPLLIAMTLEDYGEFTEGGSVFTADIIIEETSVESTEETALETTAITQTAHVSDEMPESDLLIETAAADVTAEEVIGLLSEGTVMILVNDDEFDYASLRAELLQILEGETIGEETALTEEELDEMVTSILIEKLRLYNEEYSDKNETDTSEEFDGGITSESGASADSTGTSSAESGYSYGSTDDASTDAGDGSTVSDGTGVSSSPADSSGSSSSIGSADTTAGSGSYAGTDSSVSTVTGSSDSAFASESTSGTGSTSTSDSTLTSGGTSSSGSPSASGSSTTGSTDSSSTGTN